MLLVVTPDSVFGMLVSAQALTVTMFGGVGTIWGPVIGAALLIPAGEILQAKLGARFPGIEGVIYGIAIIIVITWLRRKEYLEGAGDLLRRRPSAAPEELKPGEMRRTTMVSLLRLRPARPCAQNRTQAATQS